MDTPEANNGQYFVQYLLRLLTYPVIGAILCILVLLSISNSTPLPNPDTNKYVESSVTLKNFSIPYYSDAGEQMLLVSGESAVLASGEYLEIESPDVTYFSEKGAENELIRFSAASGKFNQQSGMAFLNGNVKITGIRQSNSKKEVLWSLKGDSVSVNQKSGKFNVSGLVKFESPNAKLLGYELQGKLDTETSKLSYIHFERQTRSLFIPR